MAKLSELAKVIRSKNSGPYQVTFDIMFDNAETYERVKASGVLGRELIRELYHVTGDDIVAELFFDPALAWKFTIKRQGKGQQGSIGEHDTYGTQQHAPLLAVTIP